MKTFSKISLLTVLIFFTSLSSGISQPATPADSVIRLQPAPVQRKEPKILSVRVVKVDTSSIGLMKRVNTAYANDIIQVLISNPKEFLLLRPTDESKLVLFADGIQLTGIYSHRFESLSRQLVVSGQVNLPDSIWIPFVLRRDATTQRAWKSLYRILDHGYDNDIAFETDLGWEGMFPIGQIKKNNIDTGVTVVFYHQILYWTWLILYFAFILFFVYLAKTTSIIREPSKDNNGPYSLSQTQLVFWTVLIIGGFIYSLTLTDLTDSLNPSILLLLGISISTTGVASFIDYSKKQKAPLIPKPHKNFLFDILSDGETINIQRTQILMWNLVFGVYFISFTIDNKTMPVFSDTLLILAGVSSSFYLGSKIPENVDPNPTAPAPVTSPAPNPETTTNNP